MKDNIIQDILNEIVQEYDQLLTLPLPRPSAQLYQKTQRILLENIERFDFFNPAIPDPIQSIKQKAGKLQSSDNLGADEFRSLDFLLFLLDSLVRQSRKITEELRDPYCDAMNVEKLFEAFLNGINVLAAQMKSCRSSLQLSDNACRILAARAFVPMELRKHDAFLYVLFRKRAFAIIKNLNADEFDRWLRIILKEFASVLDVNANEGRYDHFVKVLIDMSGVLRNEELKTVQADIYKILSNPYVSTTFFLKLFPFIPVQERPKLAVVKARQWIDTFFKGLEAGKISLLQNCLWALSIREYQVLILPEILKSAEILPYLAIIGPIHDPKTSVDTGVLKIVKWNFESRLTSLKSKFESLENENLKNVSIGPFIKEALRNIEKCPEYGMVLRRLHLLELGINEKLNSQFKLISALEKKDLDAVEKILDEAGLELWEKMANGEILLGLAVQMTILKHLSTDFLEAFIAFTRKRWAKAHFKQPWQKAMDLIELIAFNSNEVFALRDGLPFAGQWSDPSDIYLKVMKIFLPAEEHELWRKYCPDETGDFEIEKSRRDVYCGSQEAYGLFFHLSGKAAHEAITEGKPWSEILGLLGRYRKMAAFMMANVQFPEDQFLPISTKIQLILMEKSLPYSFGNPLGLGIEQFDFNICLACALYKKNYESYPGF